MKAYIAAGFLGAAMLTASCHLFEAEAVPMEKVCQNDEMNRIAQQCAYYFCNNGTCFETARDFNDAASVLKSQTPDGGWADVDYADKNRGSWKTFLHLTRMRVLAVAYRNSVASGTPDFKYSDAVIRAVALWVKGDFKNPNWWYQSIGVPYAFCEVALMLGDRCTPEMKESLKPIFKRSKMGMTSQNKVALSGIHLMKGIIYDDPEMVRAGRDSILEEMKISKRGEEGLQPDFSFHQHGPQKQFGNYGLAYFGDNAKWLFLLSGTSYAYDSASEKILANYCTQGMQWVLWKGTMDFSACGRQINRNMPAGKYNMAFNYIGELAKGLSSENRNMVNPERVVEGNRYFWCSDFMVQRNADHYFSVRMHSKRTIPCESCNSENMLGKLTADGVLLTMQTGKEYENIMPLWDWRKLPGITALQDKSNLHPADKRNRAEFVGGVSDGRRGAAVMTLSLPELNAVKAYFGFENSMIALGRDISSTSDAPVTTTVEQCWLNGPVIVTYDNEKNDKYQILPEGKHYLKNVSSVVHNEKSYSFSEPMDIVVQTGTVTGSWHDVWPAEPVDKIESGKCFLLYIDHGVKPKNASYSYRVMPIKKGEKKVIVPTSDMTTNTLCVYDESAAMAVITDSQGGEVNCVLYDQLMLKADKSCVLMLTKEDSNNYIFSAAQPLKAIKDMNMSIGGYAFKVDFPQGNDFGKHVRYRVKFSGTKAVSATKLTD